MHTLRKNTLLGILGLGLIIAGIITGKINKKVKKNRIYNAKILSCEIVDYFFSGMAVQGFEITLEILTGQGTVKKKIKRRDPLDVGETIEVYYDPAVGSVKPVDEIENSERAYPAILCVLGVILILFMCALAIAVNLKAGKDVFKIGFGFFACGLFAFVGLYLAVLRPHKLNKELVHCELVDGEVVDVVKSGRSNSGNRHRGSVMYSCVYGYQYGGKQRTIKSSTASNANGPFMIGRKVTIVINHKTGVVYCAEDEKNLIPGIIFMLFGLGGIAVMMYMLFR